MNTNKIDLIKAEVESLQKRAEHNFDISLTENERQFWLGESNVLALIEKYIDTMQEELQVKESAEIQHKEETCKENGDSLTQEPVSEVWHYQKKEPVNEIVDKSRPIIVVYGNNSLNAAGKFRYYEDNSDAIWLSNSYEKWAFVEDLINLTHSVTKVSWQEEPVSEDLEEAADNALESISHQYDIISVGSCLEMFRLGAKWQQEKEYTCYEEAFEDGAKWKNENLWKPADGDVLPEIDREVIAILDNGKVGFAHRPNPNGWDGKSLTTGKVEHYTPKTYGKGGWNIPNVKFWLDCLMPKEIEP